MPVYTLIALSSVAVFAFDWMTPRGVTEWVFYMVPLLLCIFQPRPMVPFLVAALETVLVIAGYFTSGAGVDVEIAIANRGFFVVTSFFMAYIVHRALVDRSRAERLLWLEQGRAAVSAAVVGAQELHALTDNGLRELATYVGAQVGLIHRLHNGMLMPVGAFCVDPLPHAGTAIPVGQGLVGEVARNGEILVIDDVPDNYLRIGSALGHCTPRLLVLAPVTAEKQVVGVVELGFLRRDTDLEAVNQLLRLIAERFGMSIRSALHRQHLQELLEETQQQSAELTMQQEELRVTNEELHEQSRALQESQSVLETQQKELECANAQLQERTDLLERQRSELLRTQRQLEINATELERTNRYKSEFLANMSHELRTPLNSSLILAHLLAANKHGTLTDEQIGYAKTIHAANTDLLTLINDILDLSKIEAGQVEMESAPVRIGELLSSMQQVFDPVAAQKGISFRVAADAAGIEEITTDERALKQVIKNLLANAFKFTDSGEVALAVAAAPDGRVCFAVSDTGIGIAEHQQEIIFEAFRQADGSINRTYGGTGLGLSISRELARLLGGEITLQSSPGTGSTFTLVIPRHLDPGSAPQRAPEDNVAAREAGNAMPAGREVNLNSRPHAETRSAAAAHQVQHVTHAPIADDRSNRKHDRIILIVEDDEKFASILRDLVREAGFDCLHAGSGSAALALAREFQPDAILLDVRLPDYSGLSVLERMKRDPATRHIPVHMLSVDDYKQAALELGAVGYALKPVARDEILHAIEKLQRKLSRDVSRILIVEDNAELRDSLAKMLGAEDTEIVSTGTAAEALAHLADATFDCMVMDLMLPDASGYEILEQMARGGKYAFPPVIVYTGRSLSRDEEQRLRRYSQSIIIKGARSPERLLDEVSLFLHKVETALPPEQQQALLRVRQRDAGFEGRRILIAEDDVRNVFALTSVFEPLGAGLEITRNGKEAVERLADGDIDLVLMDLMMPEMDGLTAMREIRKQPQFRDLPIIALTAKAMADDRRESLDAGANDYIAKPIDVDQLISLCRVWMPK